MTQRNVDLFEVNLRECGQNLPIDVILNECLRVLAEAKSFEPLRDVVRHVASLRQAGFAEALDVNLKKRFVGER